MTITSPEGLAMMSRLGLDRAVLARECSLRGARALSRPAGAAGSLRSRGALRGLLRSVPDK
jgi:hypothetical protein